jgi:hypothetical protein
VVLSISVMGGIPFDYSVNNNNNNNNYYYSIDSSLFERVLNLEESHQNQKEKIFAVSSLIEKLDKQLEYLYQNSEDDTKYLEFSQSLSAVKDMFLDVQKGTKYSIEAARWLHDRRDLFITYSSILIFDEQRRIRGEEHLSISIEGYRAFQKDIYNLLSWITSYLAAGGKTPKVLRKGVLWLPIEYRFYQKAFESIIDEKIMSEDMKIIPRDVLQILIDYFNRFLIDRECQEI